MRKIIILLGFMGLGLAASAQTTNPFPTTDSLRKFINKWIRNSAVDAFTNLRLNSALLAMTRFIDSAEGGGGGIAPSDTAAMLSGYTRLSRFMDSVAALRAAISGAGAGPAGPENSLQYRSGGIFAGDAGLTYNAATNKLTVDSVSQKKGIADVFKLNRIVYFSPPDSISGYGHSFVVGLNSTTTDSSFLDRIATFYDLPYINHGASGRGIWQSAQYHHQFINPGHRAMSVLMTNLNDVRRGGTGYKTVRKVVGGMNSIIANHFLKSWVPAGGGSGNITFFTAGFPGYLSSTVGGKSVGNGAFTSTLNDSIKYTFSDSTLVLGLIGADSTSGVNYNYAAFEIYIDGVLYASKSEGNMTDGISDGNNDNGRSPFAIIIRGLSFGTHTVKLVNKSATFFAVDYFGHLIDAAQGTPVLIFHDPKLDATGYAISPSNGSDAVLNSINASVDSLVANQWAGYPIYIAQTENTYVNNTSSGLDSDHIHANNAGHRQIAQAGTASLAATDVDADDGSLVLGGRLYIKLAGQTRELALTDQTIPRSDTGNFVQSFPYAVQPSRPYITGPLRVASSIFTGSNSSTTSSAPGLRVYTGGSSMFNLYKFGSDNFLFSTDSTSTTGVNLNLRVGNAFKVGVLSGGVSTDFVTMDNSAANKLAVTGNASFNSTRLGTAVTLTDAPVTAGTSFSLPSVGLYRSSGGSDSKVTQVRVDDTSFNAVLINDALNLSNYGLRIVRTGYTVKNTQLFGNVGINESNPLVKLKVTGTDAIGFPSGTTAQRPTGATGYVRFNTDSTRFEGYDGTKWVTLLPGDVSTSGGTPALTSNYIAYGVSGVLGSSSSYQYNGTNVTQSNSAARNYIVNTDALGSTSGGGLGLFNDGTPSASSQSLGNLEFGARISGNYRIGASIRALSSGAWTDGSVYRSDLIFLVTASGSATPSTGMRLNGGSRLFVGGNTVASATLHLAAGTAGASGAPFKFSSGTVQTTPEAGTMEYDGTYFSLTPASTRLRIPLVPFLAFAGGQVVMAESGGNFTANRLFGTITISTSGLTTITETQHMLTIKADATAGNITVTIGANWNGQIINIIKTSAANTVTLAASSGSLLYGSTSLTALGEGEKYQWDGTNWLALP